MDDLAIRLMVAVLGVGAVGAVAWFTRLHRRRRAERVTLDLDGVPGNVVFFTDAACSRCDRVRRMLDARQVDYVEISYGDDPAAHRRIGVTAVPLLAVRNAAGEVSLLAGIPNLGRLERIVGRAHAPR